MLLCTPYCPYGIRTLPLCVSSPIRGKERVSSSPVWVSLVRLVLSSLRLWLSVRWKSPIGAGCVGTSIPGMKWISSSPVGICRMRVAVFHLNFTFCNVQVWLLVILILLTDSTMYSSSLKNLIKYDMVSNLPVCVSWSIRVKQWDKFFSRMDQHDACGPFLYAAIYCMNSPIYCMRNVY